MTQATAVDCLAIARRLAAEPDEWPAAPRFSPRRRWFTRLAESPDYVAWLMTWLPGQGTDVHGHDAAGAVYVLRGELAEIAEPEGPVGSAVTRVLCSGSVHPLSPWRHRIVNHGTVVAVSVHVLATGLGSGVAEAGPLVGLAGRDEVG